MGATGMAPRAERLAQSDLGPVASARAKPAMRPGIARGEGKVKTNFAYPIDATVKRGYSGYIPPQRGTTDD